MMELRCWGSLFGPPSSVRSPLSKWPRTPIPHLRYGNFTTLSDTSLHTLHNDIFKFYVQEIFQRDGCRFSDQSYKTVSCISGNGIPERYDAKMHTVLAYPNVKVYSILSKLLGVGEQDPFSSTLNVLCSSCFTRQPTRLKYQSKHHKKKSILQFYLGQLSFPLQNEKRSKKLKVLMHHLLFASFLMLF